MTTRSSRPGKFVAVVLNLSPEVLSQPIVIDIKGGNALEDKFRRGS